MPTLPPTFHTAHSQSPVLVAQGAEALLYRSTYLHPTFPCALKYRPSKPYRHPILDARLTRHRILSEARVLVKCRREGVDVPAVYAADWEEGWLMMEWVGDGSVREALRDWLSRSREDAEVEKQHRTEPVRALMHRIGHAVGKMHRIGVVHGDLTTSNLMLRRRASDASTVNSSAKDGSRSLDGDVVLIDFGLAAQSVQDEDRAVDLYVLERAFVSTHPRAEGLFDEVLQAYGESYKGAKIVLKRLEDVRMRGRKRSMLG
ncbi:MAG: hypothetical protein M1817_006016 [Caeruleum heppii]|nr:MAG: hypothetical protein M1817_006016 [Caeruleum heppii]